MALHISSTNGSGGTLTGVTLSGTTTLPGSGQITSGGNIGVGVTPLKPLHAFDSTNSVTAAQLLLENRGGGNHTAAIAFQVALAGEYTGYGPKAGIAYQRQAANGRGSLIFYNRTTNDTAGYGTSDAVLTIDNGNTWTIGNGAFFGGFGGLTSSFPGLKRSGTTLQHRLADDSADGPMSASLGTFANLALASYGQIALPTGNGVGRATGLYNALGGNHDYLFLSDNYNYATSTIDSSILGTVGVILTAVNAGGGGNVRIQTGATNTAPSTRLQVDGNGITVTGDAVVSGTVKTGVYTVATLPTAGTLGRRAIVSDAAALTFGGVVVGSGSNACPVYDSGIAWGMG